MLFRSRLRTREAAGRIVGSWPAASRVRKRHRGRLEEDDRGPGPTPDILRVAHPHASDRGERRVRGDGLTRNFEGTAAGIFNGCATASTVSEREIPDGEGNPARGELRDHEIRRKFFRG